MNKTKTKAPTISQKMPGNVWKWKLREDQLRETLLRSTKAGSDSRSLETIKAK